MSASRHSFGEREQQNLEFLVARALGRRSRRRRRSSRPRRQFPAMPEVQPGLSPDRLACSPGCLPSSSCPESSSWIRSGSPTWPTAIASKAVAWSGDLAGPMRSLLAMERTALNFLQRLSGIASLTARYVAAVHGTRAAIFDTRKTTPGWRFLEKYAVRCGGGCNHRFGLYDAVLIKDNHLAWIKEAAGASGPDPFATAIASARRATPPGTTIEIEVDSLEQFDRALECSPDIILVDNLGPEQVAEAVRRRNAAAPRIQLEASGGVNLLSVRALAETGVDRISIGALTHSAPALDLALDYDRVSPFT